MNNILRYSSLVGLGTQQVQLSSRRHCVVTRPWKGIDSNTQRLHADLLSLRGYRIPFELQTFERQTFHNSFNSRLCHTSELKVEFKDRNCMGKDFCIAPPILN